MEALPSNVTRRTCPVLTRAVYRSLFWTYETYAPSGENAMLVLAPLVWTSGLSAPVCGSSSQSDSAPASRRRSPFGDHCADVTSMVGSALPEGFRSSFFLPLAAS